MWKNFFFAVMGLAFGVYICAIGFVEVLSKYNAPAEQQTSSTHGEQTKPQHLPSELLANAHALDNRGNGANEKEDTFQRVLNRITSFLFDIKITDVLLVMFTWFLADKTRGLFVETAGLRAAADQQKIDFVRSIEAAERSATAALRSAEVAEKALTEHERPWVFPGIIHMTSRKTPGNPVNDWWVTVDWSNVGRAPARLERIDVKFADIEGLSESPDYSDVNIIGVPDILIPGQPFTTQARGIGERRP